MQNMLVTHHKFTTFILGYYADVEARCQVFRVCANTDLTGKGKYFYFSYLKQRKYSNR